MNPSPPILTYRAVNPQKILLFSYVVVVLVAVFAILVSFLV